MISYNLPLFLVKNTGRLAHSKQLESAGSKERTLELFFLELKLQISSRWDQINSLANPSVRSPRGP